MSCWKLVLQLLKSDLERSYFHRAHVGWAVGRFGLLPLPPDWFLTVGFHLFQTTQSRGKSNEKGAEN